LLALLGLYNSSTFAQGEITYKFTLQQVVENALEKSPKMLETKTLQENQYWQYQTFRSNYRPQMRLSGELPNFNRSITSITLNDGSEAFAPRSYANSNLDLSISQSIGLTGGQVTVGSHLGRIDQYTDSTTISYLANPAVVTINQPLFAFNHFKWDKRIEPMRYEASKRLFLENREEVAVEATDLFFQLLLAQESKKIAELNVANSDTLYQIAKGRYNLGKIAENGLLQMELSMMNAQRDLAQSDLDVDLSNLQLNMFLGMSGTELIELIPPMDLPDFEVNEEEALTQAITNSSRTLDFAIRRTEADRNVAQARGESRLNANLFGSYGLTKSTAIFENLYTDPGDHQLFILGFDIPVIDWGRSKAIIRTAEANKKLIDVQVFQDEQGFKQEIFLLVRRFNIYRQNMDIARKADEIARKRYEITMNRYMIGKVVLLDLKDSQEEKDLARKGYIRALYNFWKSHYQLRQKTLFDFDARALITE